MPSSANQHWALSQSYLTDSVAALGSHRPESSLSALFLLTSVLPRTFNSNAEGTVPASPGQSRLSNNMHEQP